MELREDNPADDASRGITAEQLVENARWLNGPSFLWDPAFQLPIQQEWVPADGDPEVKKVKSFATGTVEMTDYFRRTTPNAKMR